MDLWLIGRRKASMHRTDVNFLQLRNLTTIPWVGASSTRRNVWTSNVLLWGVVTSRMFFVSIHVFPFACLHVKRSKNPDDLVLWARSLTNLKYSVSAWNGVVIWCLSIISGKAVKFVFLLLEIRWPIRSQRVTAKCPRNYEDLS